MKYILVIGLLFTTGILCVSCNKRLENFRINPNNPDVTSADVDLYLNEAQLKFTLFWGNDPEFKTSATDLGASLTRMEVMFGPLYQSAFSAGQLDREWSFAYNGVLKHLNAMLPIANDRRLFIHAGIAQVLKAYTLMTLVDYFGDVPYTEANGGIENTNPKPDKGADIYKSALGLLDTAILNFAKVSAAGPANDLFYNGDAKKWTKCAKTLKLRAYLTTRLVDAATSKSKITELLNDNDLINADADEFVFRFSSQQSNPDSRHPNYSNNYRAAGGANDYIGTHFLWALTEEKGLTDPRVRYYIYRQTLVSTGWDAFTLPCAVRNKPTHYTASMPFCIFPNGYWGRDHANNEGIPPDKDKRSTWGIYPAGGSFDDSQGRAAILNDGAKGQGILPIWMASFTDFLRAEAALTLQTPGDARVLLQSAIRKSIARVVAYPAQAGITVPASRVPSQAVIDGYVNKVLSLYDQAATADDKLNVIIREWYLALWGNGVDSYNNYRRTGKPDNFQFAVSPSPGNFIRTFFYPANFVNLNVNVEQKPGVAQKTFWDINPDNLYR